MVELPLIVSRIRPQDVGVFIAFLVAVFLFRAPDVFEFTPSWRLHVAQNTNGSHFQSLLPNPIIADLENDGTNELVIATSDAKIKIWTFPLEQLGSESVLPHLHLKVEHSLLKETKDAGVFPVAMATGCQEKTPEEDCQHVIIVVTSDWTVYCFSNFLTLLWKTQVGQGNHPTTPENFKEVAANIVSQSYGGLVIVGGRSSDLYHTKTKKFGHDHDQNHDPSDNVEQLANSPRVHHQVQLNKATREAGHFSTYALDSKSGKLRWQHTPGDFESNTTAKQKLLTAYHFKLALQHDQHHIGEVHWNQYQASILRTLPLRWTHPTDTSFDTALFQKGATGSGSNKPEVTQWFGSLDANADFLRAKDQSAISEHNALVIRSHQGLEVLKLKSGQPLCRYALTHEGTTVGDINSDDVIDHVRAHFTAQQHVPTELPSCSAVVTSESKVLFTGPLCTSNSLFSEYLTLPDEGDERDTDYEPFPVPPLLVPAAPHRRGVFRHLMGHNLRLGRTAGMDAVFLVSTGRVTSYGPHGEENWQVKVKGAWKHYVRQDDHGQVKSDDAKHRFFPSLQAVELADKSSDYETALVISSWYHLSLVSLIDGAIMASHTLPCQPVAPIVSGDFTNDGLSDFVIQCNDSYLGFAMDRRPGYLWTTVWVACGLLVTLLALGIMRLIEEELT